MSLQTIFGAPGCGKTYRLMNILSDELKLTRPDKIAFVSFTRKGTYEGVERAKSIGGYTANDLPFFRTLHSIAFRAGEYSKYDMISKSDYKSFSDAMGMKFTGYYTEEFYHNDDRYLFMHFMKRNNAIAAERFSFDMDTRKLSDVENNFQRFKAFAKVHDFTDIIEHFIEVGEPLPVDIAIIDEAQDLTTLQWKMCEIAFKNCKRIYVAGDDDQAIYEWSGADVSYFLNLKADSREILAKSYRLPECILKASKKIAKMIKTRVAKDFEPFQVEGSISCYNELNELDLSDQGSWYFLSRNNFHATQYIDFLRKNAAVFTHKEKPSFEQKHIDAINVYETWRNKKKISDADEMKLKLVLKGEPDLTKPWFDNFNIGNDLIAYYRDLIRTRANLKINTKHINTIHGVKGGEADNVVLLLDCTKAVATTLANNPDSELRCLYVAMTRAKKNLHLVYSSGPQGYDRFVKEALHDN